MKNMVILMKKIIFRFLTILCLLSVDSTRLLAGFARGQVIEYDMMTGKLLRDIQDVHPQGIY